MLFLMKCYKFSIFNKILYFKVKKYKILSGRKFSLNSQFEVTVFFKLVY